MNGTERVEGVRRRSHHLLFLAVLLAGVLGGVTHADDEAVDSLSAVKARGVLEVALYGEFPPYSYKARKGGPAGIDVDLAKALAKKLGMQAKVRLFAADENMSDDLRNHLWKGHYLGGGVADVMLHVPMDRKFAEQEDKAVFFGPYFSEAVAVVYHPDRMEAFESPLVLSDKKVGVEIDSISDYYMSGAFGGRLRTAAVRHPSVSDAVEAFRKGEVDAVMAPRGELQGLMRQQDFGDVAFKQQELVGLFRTSWDIGMATKQRDGDTTLRDALDRALRELQSEGGVADIFAKHGVTYVMPSAGAVAHASE